MQDVKHERSKVMRNLENQIWLGWPHMEKRWEMDCGSVAPIANTISIADITASFGFGRAFDQSLSRLAVVKVTGSKT